MESKVTLLSNTSVNADSENHESQDREHFDHRKPELDFSIESNRKEIEQCDYDPEDGDKDGYRQFIVPILNDQTGGSQFHRVCRSPIKPINPTHRATQTGIDESCGVGGERTGDRKIRCDLTCNGLVPRTYLISRQPKIYLVRT